MAFTINAYVLHDGGDVVTSWISMYERRPKVIARMDARMTYLRQQPKDSWTRPYYDTLRDGVGEIRFKAMEKLHRPIGFFGPTRHDFTFLYFATKRKAFEPPNAIDIAVVRRLEIENKTARVVQITRWDQ